MPKLLKTDPDHYTPPVDTLAVIATWPILNPGMPAEQSVYSCRRVGEAVTLIRDLLLNGADVPTRLTVIYPQDAPGRGVRPPTQAELFAVDV